MNYYLCDNSFYSKDELKHYGILGMKWGVRRYQNKDGTLTPDGKRRLRGEVEKAYGKSSNMREFGKTLVSQKGMRSYLLRSDSASELARKTTSYITDARRVNYDANMAANKEARKAVGGKISQSFYLVKTLMLLKRLVHIWRLQSELQKSMAKIWPQR